MMRAQGKLTGAEFYFLSLSSHPRKTLLMPPGHPQRAIKSEAHSQALGLQGSLGPLRLTASPGTGIVGRSRLCVSGQGEAGSPGLPFTLFWGALKASLFSRSPHYSPGA